MQIKTNGLIYDSQNPNCDLIASTTAATGGYGGSVTIAFLTVVDELTGRTSHFWGMYDPKHPADYIKLIMEKGTVWPPEFHPRYARNLAPWSGTELEKVQQ